MSGPPRIALPVVVAALAFLLLAGSLRDPRVAPRPLGNHGNQARWRLIFDDEFGGSSLDTANWSTGWYGSGITGPISAEEKQCYGPAQVVVGHGELDLNVVARAQRCNASSQITRPYVSGIVTTRGRFTYAYGYLEARAWIPGGRSIADWPAVWADGQSWPTNGELDLVEGLRGSACWHFHDPLGGPGACSSKKVTGGWHTFGADWEKGMVTWYYDGVRVGAVAAGITDDPMYLVVDLATDVTYGGPIEVPASLRIDYVRVWQH